MPLKLHTNLLYERNTLSVVPEPPCGPHVVAVAHLLEVHHWSMAVLQCSMECK